MNIFLLYLVKSKLESYEYLVIFFLLLNNYNHMRLTEVCFLSSGITLSKFWYFVPSLREEAVAENNVCNKRLFSPRELM